MAFTPITSAQIEIGEATKKEIFSKTKDNFDDHETRIGSLESGATSTIPMAWVIKDSAVVYDDAAQLRVPFDITITSVVLEVVEAGSAGTLEVDVLSDQGGSFTTVLSGGNLTRAFGDGSTPVTSSGITGADVDAGKHLRLDIKAVQTGMRDAYVVVTYTVR